MLDVAWQQIRRQPGRFAALTVAVALPVVMVLLPTAVYLGLLDALVAYPRTLPADVIVSEAGSSPILMRSSSSLPQATVDAVRAVPGVAGVDVLHSRLVWVEKDGTRSLVFVVGLAPNDAVGGPLALVSGKADPELNEVIVDRVLADDLGLELRESLRIGAARFRVSAIADGGNSMIGTYAFVNRNALVLAGVFQPSHLLLRVAPGVDPALVVERVGRLPGAEAFTRAQFLDETLALAQRFYRPVIGVIAGIAVLVGALILGLTLWVSAIQQRAELGLLKAIGVPPSRLYALVLWQAALVTALGAGLGIVAGYAVADALGTALPRFVTRLPWWVAAVVGCGAIGVGLAAALAPLRAVRRVEPGLVFRA